MRDKADFIGTCVSNPFKTVKKLCDIIDNGREISKRTFFKNCDVGDDLKREMREYPYDYQFFKNGKIYFYSWSCIEHFYVRENENNRKDGDMPALP